MQNQMWTKKKKIPQRPRQRSQFSSLEVATTIASTRFGYPWRNDEAELALMAWLNSKLV